MKAPTDKRLNVAGHAIAMACPADPNAARSVQVCIRWREFVTTLAVCLACASGERAGAAVNDVHALRDGLNVGGIHTAGISAEMVCDEALWDRSDKHLVRDMVSDSVDAIPLQVAIAERQLCPCPDPATSCLLDLRPEGFGGLIWRHRASASATEGIAAPQGVARKNSFGSALAGATPQRFAERVASDVLDGRQSTERLAGHVDGPKWQIHGASQC